MKLIKKMFLSVFCALSVLGGLCFVACKEDGDNSNGGALSELAQTYALYVQHMEASGDTPISYEDWLAIIAGERGEKSRGIENAFWTQEGELILVLTDNSEVNVGKIQLLDFVHTYGDWQDMISTCTARWQVRICVACDDTQARSVAPTGHMWEDGVCETCNVYFSNQYNGTYGYEYLGTMENGKALQSLYKDINAVVCDFHADNRKVAKDNVVAELSFVELGLTANEALAVLKTFKGDNPLFYWLSNEVQYTFETLKLFAVEEYANGEARAECTEMLYSKIQEYTDMMKGETSEYTIALAYHDAIVKAIDYAYDTDNNPSKEHWAHSVLGVFEEKGGVCESYARAYQLLLNVSGVENVFVTGYANGEEHAWNMVRLDDGEWYCVDLTWDDTPDWEWGISYNYFAVAEGQKVNWSDGGWLENEDKTFQMQHEPNMPTGEGLEFQYALPTVATVPFNLEKGLQLRELFTVDGNTYAVVGYNAVQLSDSICTGALTIPETVTYEGRTYTVISIGRITPENLFDEGNAVGKATSVSIPKTVRFIWDSAVSADGRLEEITVDENNEYFVSKDGVLFTKSLYTLIQYPESHSRTEYAIPNETVEVAYHAFTSGFQLNLKQLTLGIKMQAFGMANWGNGYKNQPPTGWFGGNQVAADLVVLCDNLKRRNTQIPIVVAEGNTGFYVDEIALYDHEQTSLLYVFDSEITMFEIPVNLKWISQIVSVDYNFRKLPNLERFVVAEGNTHFSEQDGVLYNADKTEILYVPQGKSGELIIANGVEKINAFTFDGCRKLTAVFIPKSVKEVRADAFIGCSHLTIYCETQSLPSTWDKKWNKANCTVVWGYTDDTNE